MSVDLNCQSFVLDEKEGIRCSTLNKSYNLPKLRYQKYSTLLETFELGLNISRDKPCLGWRPTPEAPYQWMTYQEMYDTFKEFGAGLLYIAKLKQGVEECVGIYATNSPQWLITQHANIMYRLVSVPLYDTLGVEASRFITDQTEMKVIVCDTVERAQKILTDHENRPYLQHVIVVEEGEAFEKLQLEYKSLPIDILKFKDVVDYGKKHPIEAKRPVASDLMLICYTSGTTGLPKGVMLTHENLVACATGFEPINNGKNDHNTVHFSYLPLAHSMEQATCCFLLGVGASIGFTSGSTLRLLDDIQALRPTLLMVVPRVLTRIYNKVKANVETSYVKSKLFEYGIYYKLKYLEETGLITKNTWWDWFVFSKIQNLVGGRLNYMYCGGAPLEPEVMKFCKAAFGCHVYEGYGTTETSSGVVSNVMWEYRCNGAVGPPILNCHIKLADVPELNIVAKRDNRGEVCVRGPICTKGYYKNPELTKKLIDQDGWLHLGDIGEWTPEGCLRIVDRCKNIFKLSQGEYVAPERIEMVYALSKFVAQVFVDGNSLQSCPISLVVPNEITLGVALSELDGETITDEEAAEMYTLDDVCNDPRSERLILDDMKKQAKARGLRGFEQVKSIHLVSKPFNVDDGTLTPTQKMCRNILRKRYAAEIKSMYESMQRGRD